MMMTTHLIIFLLGMLFGLAFGAWAMRSDLMEEHKSYFNKQKELREWKSR